MYFLHEERPQPGYAPSPAFSPRLNSSRPGFADVPFPFIGAAFRDVKGKLYPSVGLKKYGEHIRTNFGQSPFVFDIDGMMRVGLPGTWVCLFPWTCANGITSERNGESTTRYGRRSEFFLSEPHDDSCLLFASPSDLELRLGGAPVTLSETDLIQSFVCESSRPLAFVRLRSE